MPVTIITEVLDGKTHKSQASGEIKLDTMISFTQFMSKQVIWETITILPWYSKSTTDMKFYLTFIRVTKHSGDEDQDVNQKMIEL